MDRSWMTKPRREPAYKDGVDQFLSFAFRDLPHDSKIACPCINCENRVIQNRDEVETHLKCDGILQGYTVWNHHGEEYDPPSFAFAHVPDNDGSMPTLNVPVENSHGRLDDMQGLLQAVFPPPASYESLSSMSGAELDDIQSNFTNMEHNIAEDVMSPAEDNTTNTEDDTHASFFKDAHTRLYPALPPEANLPKTYYEAKKIIRAFGLDYVKIHACPKDCMLFRGDRAKQETCHVCKSSRWKDDEKNGSPAQPKRKNKPAKVLRYFPLIPRIQRLFATNKTSDDMRWHDEPRPSFPFQGCSGVMAPGEKKILVARKGRLRQRYDGEHRLVAGCVLYRVGADGHPELLMVSTPNRDDLVFPKGGWEDDEDVHEAACREALEEAGVKGAINRTALGMWVFRSKSSPVSGDSPRGACKGYIFALEVAKELEQWPEQDTHGRRWVSPADAYRLCRYDWMREALSALLDRLAAAKPAAPELDDHSGVYMMVKAAAATADRAVALC